MQHKKTILFVTLIVLFSLSGFSQADSTSEHPLLDKYYPQKKVDTNRAVANEIKPAPETKTAPVISAPAIKPAPLAITAPAVKTAPAIDTPVVTAPTTISVPVETIAQPSTMTAVVTAPVVKKAAIDTSRILTPQKITPKSKTEGAYYRTRLGSSSKLYDTYEKNNNGAGSVTTNPK